MERHLSVRSGVVERFACYALSLNAEPPACRTNDYRLSAGCREAEPAREGFTSEGYPLARLRSLLLFNAIFRYQIRSYPLQPFVSRSEPLREPPGAP